MDIHHYKSRWVAMDLKKYKKKTRIQVYSSHDQVINLVVEGWPHILMIAGPGIYRGPAAIGLSSRSFKEIRGFLETCKEGWFEPGLIRFCHGLDEFIITFNENYVDFAPPAKLNFDAKKAMSILPQLSGILQNKMTNYTSSILIGVDDEQDFFQQQINTFFPQLTAALIKDNISAFQASCNELIGLGQGSTPTGDDLIFGALVTFHYYKQSQKCSWRPPAFSENIKKKTTILGSHMLEIGRRGLAPEPVKEFLLALFQGEFSPESLQKLGKMGASTGYDIATACFSLVEELCALNDP